MITSKTARSTAKMVLSRTRQKLHPVLRVVERGDARYCPCCQSHLRRFKPYGEVVVRPEAMCGVCGSVERDRLMHFFYKQKTDLLRNPKKLLHITPELNMKTLFRSVDSIDYLSADIADVSAMVRMDITDIQ